MSTEESSAFAAAVDAQVNDAMNQTMASFSAKLYGGTVDPNWRPSKPTLRQRIVAWHWGVRERLSLVLFPHSRAMSTETTTNEI